MLFYEGYFTYLWSFALIAPTTCSYQEAPCTAPHIWYLMENKPAYIAGIALVALLENTNIVPMESYSRSNRSKMSPTTAPGPATLSLLGGSAWLKEYHCTTRRSDSGCSRTHGAAFPLYESREWLAKTFLPRQTTTP